METTPKETSTVQTQTLTVIGLLAALLCVLAPFSVPIPVSPVPISLATLAINFCAVVGGFKRGTISVVVYLLLGFIGVPVFVGWTAGFQKLAGPTGGYLIGFVFIAAITGFFVDKFDGKLSMSLLGMLIGAVVCNLFGTVWLAILMKVSFGKALLMGVIPYIPGDAVKIAIVLFVALPLRRRLQSAGFLK